MERHNPILPGFNPDPSICRVDDDFFLVTSTFEYFPGVPIYHSKDLVQWQLIGHALSRQTQLRIVCPEPGSGIWAPTLRYHKGMFYLATACFNRFRPEQGERLFPRGFYIKTANIWDPSCWSDPVFFDVIGFDQDLFWDTDGTAYLSTTHTKLDRPQDADQSKLDFAIHLCKVDLHTGDSISEPVLIRESKSGIAEGSHIFRRGKYYYLVTAEGGTGAKHSVWAFRNQEGPLGGWYPCPDNPLLNSTADGEVQNTGHADFVEDAHGNWWAVLLGVRPHRKSCTEWEESVLGRETFLVPVQWKDDWPIVNGGKPICIGPKRLNQPSFWEDRFAEPTMASGWYRKNSPEKIDHSLIRNPSRLRLFGGPYNLSSPASPTMFLRKQTSKVCLWKTRLSFNPTSEREEAGAVVWWNYFTNSSIGVRASKAPSDSSARIVRFRSASGEVVDREVFRGDLGVELYVRCGRSYEFGFSEMDENGDRGPTIQWLGSVSNELMTSPPPSGLAFSGMLLGLYAFADYQKSLNPADFYYAQCIVQEQDES